ncbi:MAG: hypothetical protein HY302_00760 [Opitutae bacterium]|nr:hypothetical protein [Opitutae bacterium]
MPARPPTCHPALPGIGDDEINAHFGLLPDSYFAQAGAAEVTLHLRMVNRLLQSINAADSLGSLRPVIEWHDAPGGEFTAVHVVTWDRAGLFYKLAGSCSVAGLNILAARITTRSDHIAIDTFSVAEPGGGAVRDERAKARFVRSVEDALVNHADLLPAILAQQQAQPAPAPPAASPPTVELFADHGFNLSSARVTTERGQAVDTFHLEPEDPAALDDARLATLRTAVLGAISGPALAAG